MKGCWLVWLFAVVACHEPSLSHVSDLVALEDGGAVVAWMANQRKFHLRRIDVGGQLLWDTDLSNESISITSGIVIHDHIAVLRERRSDDSVVLRAFDLEDGHLAWRSNGPNAKRISSRTVYARTPSSLIVAFDDEVVALDPATGREQHRAAIADPTRPLVVGGHAIFEDVSNTLVIGPTGHWAGPVIGGCTSAGNYYGIEREIPGNWLVTIPANGLVPQRVAKLPDRSMPLRCFGYRGALVVVGESWTEPMTGGPRTYIDVIGRDGAVHDSTTVLGTFEWQPRDYGAFGETTRLMPLLQRRGGLFVLDLERLHEPPVHLSALEVLTMARSGSHWHAAEYEGRWVVLDGANGFFRTVHVRGELGTYGGNPDDGSLIAGGSLWLYSGQWTRDLGVTRLDATTLVPTLPSTAIPIFGVDSNRETTAQSGRSGTP